NWVSPTWKSPRRSRKCAPTTKRASSCSLPEACRRAVRCSATTRRRRSPNLSRGRAAKVRRSTKKPPKRLATTLETARKPVNGGYRMRFLALIVLCFAAACASPTAAPSRNPAVDALAERYVRMALEMDTHERGFVDSYYGDPAWKTEAEAHRRAVP